MQASPPSIRDHDGIGKNLFSKKPIFLDFAQGFLGEELSALVDWESLTLVKNSHLGDRRQRRDNDVIWQVLLKEGQPVYLYVMLELQSSEDGEMVLRIGEYMFLLWRRLYEQNECNSDGSLPLIWPIVLCTNDVVWSKPTSLAQMLPPVPACLQRWTPRLEFMLLEEQQLAGLVDPSNNIVAAMFDISANRDESRKIETYRVLDQVAKAERFDLGAVQQALTDWVNDQFLAMQSKGITIDTVVYTTGKTLMSAKRIEEFYDIVHARGEARGEARGKAEGEALALEKARLAQVQVCLKTLERRFQSIDPFSTKRIEQASFTQLTQWCLQVDAFDNVVALLDGAAV